MAGPKTLQNAVDRLSKAAAKNKSSDIVLALKNLALLLRLLKRPDSERNFSDMQNYIASFVPIYCAYTPLAFSVCSFLLQEIQSTKSPAGRLDWEAIQRALLSSALDFLEDHRSQENMTYAKTLWPFLTETYFPDELECSTGQPMLSMVYLFLFECIQGQGKAELRKAISPRVLGAAVARSTDYLALENLLDLLGSLVSPLELSKRRTYLAAVFTPQLFSNFEQILDAMIQLKAGDEWDEARFRVIDVLSKADIRFPQPFHADNMCVCGQSFHLSGPIFVDGPSLTITVVIDSGEVDTIKALYADIDQAQVKNYSSSKPSIVIMLHQPPKLGNEPLQNDACDMSVSFAFDSSSSMDDFLAALRNRGVSNIAGARTDAKLSLSQADVTLDFYNQPPHPPVKNKVQEVQEMLSPPSPRGSLSLKPSSPGLPKGPLGQNTAPAHRTMPNGRKRIVLDSDEEVEQTGRIDEDETLSPSQIRAGRVDTITPKRATFFGSRKPLAGSPLSDTSLSPPLPTTNSPTRKRKAQPEEFESSEARNDSGVFNRENKRRRDEKSPAERALANSPRKSFALGKQTGNMKRYRRQGKRKGDHTSSPGGTDGVQVDYDEVPEVKPANKVPHPPKSKKLASAMRGKDGNTKSSLFSPKTKSSVVKSNVANRKTIRFENEYNGTTAPAATRRSARVAKQSVNSERNDNEERPKTTEVKAESTAAKKKSTKPPWEKEDFLSVNSYVGEEKALLSPNGHAVDTPSDSEFGFLPASTNLAVGPHKEVNTQKDDVAVVSDEFQALGMLDSGALPQDDRPFETSEEQVSITPRQILTPSNSGPTYAEQTVQSSSGEELPSKVAPIRSHSRNSPSSGSVIKFDVEQDMSPLLFRKASLTMQPRLQSKAVTPLPIQTSANDLEMLSAKDSKIAAPLPDPRAFRPTEMHHTPTKQPVFQPEPRQSVAFASSPVLSFAAERDPALFPYAIPEEETTSRGPFLSNGPVAMKSRPYQLGELPDRHAAYTTKTIPSFGKPDLRLIPTTGLQTRKRPLQDQESFEKKRSTMDEIMNVMDDLHSVLRNKVYSRFENVRVDLRMGRDMILRDAANHIQQTHDVAVEHYRCMVGLEQEYAAGSRSIRKSLESIAELDREMVERVESVVRVHDRESLVKKIPSSLFMSPVPNCIATPSL